MQERSSEGREHPVIAVVSTVAETTGGDAACWLHRVCPECGGLDEHDGPTCPRCGASYPEPADG